jgi:hypothetical protein
MIEITEKEVELNNMLGEKLDNYIYFLRISIHNRSIIIDRPPASLSRFLYITDRAYRHLNLINLSVEVEHDVYDRYGYDFIHR